MLSLIPENVLDAIFVLKKINTMTKEIIVNCNQDNMPDLVLKVGLDPIFIP